MALGYERGGPACREVRVTGGLPRRDWKGGGREGGRWGCRASHGAVRH